MSQPKKSNFLPLLLIGGGVASAALLYGFSTKQSKEDISLGGGFGVGGSGDFLGSSGIGKGYDSTDLGIEDFAFNRATPDAFTLPSDGAANPERVVDESGAWTFADTAVLGLTAAAAAPAVLKGIKSVGTKLSGSSVLRTAGRAAGVVGVASLAPLAVETGIQLGSETAETLGGSSATSVTTVFKTLANTVGNILTYPAQVLTNGIKTDEATKQNVGNMTTPRQEAHAKGLSGGKYPITKATPEEAALVNKAVGLTSGDVLKVSGTIFTSYIPEKGMQVTYSSGGTLQGTVNTILQNKAKTTSSSSVSRSTPRRRGDD